MADIRTEALALIDGAFADAPRPANDDLLHEDCLDDNDIVALYEVAHWRDMSDSLVESEYAALSFLSPAGFRHFIPAYMRFALRHADGGAAAVDATIWSLAPVFYEDAALQEFTESKLTVFEQPEREALVAFLAAVRDLADEHDRAYAERALGYWRGRAA